MTRLEPASPLARCLAPSIIIIVLLHYYTVIHGNELIIRSYLSTSVGQSEMGIQSVARAPRKREMEFVSSLDHFLLYFITSLARGWPIDGLGDRDLGKHWQTLMELIRSDCSVTRCPSESDQTRRYTQYPLN